MEPKERARRIALWRRGPPNALGWLKCGRTKSLLRLLTPDRLRGQQGGRCCAPSVPRRTGGRAWAARPSAGPGLGMDGSNGIRESHITGRAESHAGNHWPDFTPPRSELRRRSIGPFCHRRAQSTRRAREPSRSSSLRQARLACSSDALWIITGLYPGSTPRRSRPPHARRAPGWSGSD